MKKERKKSLDLHVRSARHQRGGVLLQQRAGKKETLDGGEREIDKTKLGRAIIRDDKEKLKIKYKYDN